MAAAAERARREEFLIEAEFFRRNALMIIQEMDNLSQRRHSVLVDEVLHSILFLGHINNPRFTPEDILGRELNEYQGRYPHPFECYSTQLPKRAPISCVLEMFVNLMGQENQEEIYLNLRNFINELKRGETKHLVSNTFCVSHKISKNPIRYYGVSMSTSGPNPGRVMIAASCLSCYWDSRIADAVMTYDLIDQRNNPGFDGTITLPQEVRCQAFSLSQQRREINPCRSCSDLFGLTTIETKVWRYGNCAEPESLSNLLQNETDVTVHRTWPSDKGRDNARESVLTNLKRILRMLQFNWHEEFYTPQDLF